MFSLCITVGSRIIGPPEFVLSHPIVNKPCNIKCYGNKMHQIVANMVLTQYLQFKLICRKGQLYQVVFFILDWGRKKIQNYWNLYSTEK